MVLSNVVTLQYLLANVQFQVNAIINVTSLYANTFKQIGQAYRRKDDNDKDYITDRFDTDINH